jgi:AraC family transcriptional regulator
MEATPFTLEQTHGIVTLPGCRVRASSERLGWTSLFISAQCEAPFEARVDPVRDHLIVVHLGGPVRVSGRVDSQSANKLVPPGGIFLWPAGHGFDIRLDQAVDTLHLYIRRSLVEHVAISMGYAGCESLAPRLCESDALLEQLALEVWHATGPAVEDSLYAEHLALAIAARLIRYQNLGRALPKRSKNGGLTRTQLKRLQEHIEDRLAEAIRLEDLSSETGLSVSHFVRQFRRSVGVSPHRFVLGRRIARACRLLVNSEDTIADIALACGFSHQEHMTHMFNRMMGTTPRSYRLAGQR